MKNLIIKTIGFRNYRLILVTFCRIINNFHIKRYFCITESSIKKIFKKNKNIYYGYYDTNSNYDDKVLFIETSNNTDERAKIGYYDRKFHYLTETSSWNMQMGARLRWYDQKNILFNDYNGKHFVTKKYNIETKNTITYDFPIYDISPDMNYSFFLNFSILNKERPGYGYSNINEKIDYNENGIYRGDFNKNDYKCILSIEEIINYNYKEEFKNSTHYLNHISCSKFDNKLIFFHLWYNSDKELRNRVFYIDFDGNIINVIDDFDRASHYCFKSKNEILLTVVSNNRNQYRLYKLYDSTYKTLEFLTEDGHPTYVDKDRFITDTYPDHNGMQHIYLCDMNHIILEICQIYHNPTKVDEYRCDLHPRYYDKKLTFDSLEENYKSQYVLNIDLSNKENMENYKKNELKISAKAKLYKFLNSKIDYISLKVLFANLFNFSFKAHYTLIKMLNSKNRFLKNLYFNKLQAKYSIWISSDAKIGENFRMMHFDGITIGSGAIIGDNCTIYQQVTIGKDKNKFPTIGKNVTIYSGAKVIGGITIGDNVIIGANSVVNKSIPANCTVVGIPGKIIKRDKEND